MSTHVDGNSPSVAPDPDDEAPRDGGGVGSDWVRTEMQRRMAANRSTRGRHARRTETARSPQRDTTPAGRRSVDTPPAWAATPVPPGDLPENYVPRHSVQTPGPPADPARPAGDAAGTGTIGGPSLPPTGLPMRRRRGPGTPLQSDGAAAVGPWSRPGSVVPHKPARPLSAPPEMLGGPDPIPAWGLPLATPVHGFPVPGQAAESAEPDAGRSGAVEGGALPEPGGPGRAIERDATSDGDTLAGTDRAPAYDAVPDDAVADDSVPDDTVAGGAVPDDVDVEPDEVAADDEAIDDDAPTCESPVSGAPAGADPVSADVLGAHPVGGDRTGGPVNGAPVVDAPRADAAPADAVLTDGAGHVNGSVHGSVNGSVNGVAAPTPGPRRAVGPPDSAPLPDATAGENAGRVVDPPTAPHPVVRPRQTVVAGRAVGVPAQRTAESARAVAPRPVTPRQIPVVGTAPPEPGSTRVRVVLSERKGVARPVRTIKEVQEGTAVGDLLRRDLIRSQLFVTLRFALLTVVVLGALPAVFALMPAVSRFHLFGVRLPWLVLGLLMYPFLVGVAWCYTRVADRVEQNFADHVQD